MNREDAMNKLTAAGYDYDDARFWLLTWGASPTGLLAEQPQGELPADVIAILSEVEYPRRETLAQYEARMAESSEWNRRIGERIEANDEMHDQ